MRIAFNTRFGNYSYSEGYGNFTREIGKRITSAHPEASFLFLSDQEEEYHEEYSSNVEKMKLGPPARHPLLWKYWYDWSVPVALKNWKADLFFSPDGFCSLRTKIPQCMVLHDLAFLHDPGYLPASRRSYYKRMTPRMIRKVNRLITISDYSGNEIIQHYPEAKEKIRVIPNGCSEAFIPLGIDEKEAIKKKVSDGREYFLYVGSIHPRKNLVTLLKAFSWFKKRQQSNMKLLIAGRLAWGNDPFLDLLERFKFRSDVELLGYVEQTKLHSLVASAYALVYPSLYEGFGLPVVEGMKAGVPVICSGLESLKETAGEAALFVDPHNPEQMGEAMARIFKDEKLRDQYIQKGLLRATKYNWTITADLIWQVLMESLS